MGSDHLDTINVAYNLAIIYKELDQKAEAKKLFTLVLEGYEKQYGPDHEDTLETKKQLASLDKPSSKKSNLTSSGGEDKKMNAPREINEFKVEA